MLYLIRGVPGSGKSSYARALGCLVVESDQMCLQDGIYKYDHQRIARAHAWCLRLAQSAICENMDVAVANPFPYVKYMAPYVGFARQHGCGVTIVECTRKYGNPHRIPSEVIAKMRATWEPLPEAWVAEMRVITVGGWNAAEERTRIGAESSDLWFTVAMGQAS